MSGIDVKNMTPSQRVLAMEALWDSMCHQETEPDSPEWHENLLEERRAKIEAGESGFLTLRQLRDRLAR